jgi:hypothetical protein
MNRIRPLATPGTYSRALFNIPKIDKPGVFLQAGRILPNVNFVASTEIVPDVSVARGARLRCAVART